MCPKRVRGRGRARKSRAAAAAAVVVCFAGGEVLTVVTDGGRRAYMRCSKSGASAAPTGFLA